MNFKVKLRPWMTPNCVIAEMPPRPRQDGFRESPSWPLSDVDVETLSQLCDKFRREVFKKAGKADPMAAERKESA